MLELVWEWFYLQIFQIVDLKVKLNYKDMEIKTKAPIIIKIIVINPQLLIINMFPKCQDKIQMILHLPLLNIKEANVFLILII